jgi:hypothetical protein
MRRNAKSKIHFASTLVIAASIIAADISRPSSRIASMIADCVELTRMILEKILR